MSDYGRLVEETRDDVRLGSGKIISPVSFIDLTLPAGYSLFQLKMLGVRFSVPNESICAVFSFNGTSFLCDTTNYDSYNGPVSLVKLTGVNAAGQIAAINPFSGADSLAPIGANHAEPFASSLNCLIDPGGPENFASFIVTEAWGMINIAGSHPFEMQYQSGFISVNPYAIVAPARQRAKILRLVPYGSEDADPPTSGHTITAGSYVLTGTPQ